MIIFSCVIVFVLGFVWLLLMLRFAPEGEQDADGFKAKIEKGKYDE